MKLFLVALTASTIGMASLITNARCSAMNSTQLDVHSAAGMDSASTTCLVSGNGRFVRAEASALADHGRLRSPITAVGNDILTLAFSNAFASYTDTLTILGTGTGSIRVTLAYHLYTIDGGAGADFSLGSYRAPTRSTPFEGDFVATVPIEFGARIPISASLSAQGSSNGSSFVLTTFSFLQFFEVLDNLGQRLNAFEYISESEGNYSFVGGTRVAIPEPTSATLVFIGMAACGFLRPYRRLRG